MRTHALLTALGASALLAACGGRPEASTEPQETAAPSRPMTREAGAWAVHLESRVTFEADPSRPHTLEVDLAFPDRSRWMLSIPDPGEARRVALWRDGDLLWSAGVGSSESLELVGADRTTSLLTLSLRRAVACWPGGLPWEGDGEERSASLADGCTARALLGTNGLPSELGVLLPDGTPWEVLTEIEWDGGEHPRRWKLRAGGRTLWTEEVLDLDRSRRYLETYFVPPDRRAQSSSTGSTTQWIQLPERLELRWAVEANGLPGPSEWESLRREAQRALPPGLTLQPGHGRVLGPDGAWSHLVLEADRREPDTEAAEGMPPVWRSAPAVRALAGRAPAQEGLWAEALVSLGRAVGAAGDLMVWVDGPGGSELRATQAP